MPASSASKITGTPDPDGDQTRPTYGATIDEADSCRIPAGDLPFGGPSWVGDDHWGRTDTPRHHNCVQRDRDDPDHVLCWQAPQS